MDKLGSLSFGKVLGGLVVVGLGVDMLNNINHKAALILVVVILISIMVVNPGTTTVLVQRLADLRGFLFGG